MIPLFKPYMPDELPELDGILHSGALAYGKWGKEFEQKLADFIGEQRIAVVNSYNSAMLVALATIGIQHGDEVIASPMSCLASNQPLVTQGAKVIWADIDPTTGTLDPESVRLIITSKTKAIFHNHHCGYPGYIDEINAIGKEHGIFVVDDAIEAFGAEYKDNMIGNVGTDITVFSFQTVRLPNTIDGGGLAFNHDDLFEKAKKIRDLGVGRTLFRDKSGEISPECDINLPGFGATLSEVNSYIGFLQLDAIDNLLWQQRENAAKWEDLFFETLPEIDFLNTRHASNPNYWVFGVLATNKQKMIALLRSKGYYASGVHLNNNCYSVFDNHAELPGVSTFYSRFFAVPSGWWFNLK
jgi:dTDP-4-amino-4,6-dideoxygalactose transaminase